MSSDETAIKVEAVSKCYELYDRPSDQLKQYFLPKIQRLVGAESVRYYRQFWALSDVSFEVKKGEAFGIVGRNGSGKSTLLQIIAGTLAPTSGTVSTHGRVAALLELGSGFNPEFTGRENAYMNGALLGFSREEMDDRFDAIAAFADIGIFLDQAVKSYSSGMLVRLAISVQMQVSPDVLIVDEALAVGDALFQKRCYRQINKLLDDGCTLLFVSHDQEVVRSLTQRAIFLNEGKVIDYGKSSDVLFSYRQFLQKAEESAFADIQRRLESDYRASDLAKSYGGLDVEILQVTVLDASGSPVSALYAGDWMIIQIDCISHVNIENLNIAFRVVTKEGVKVTTWGTLNEDMPLFAESPEKAFWSKKFQTGQRFSVKFSGVCRLSANLYEVQAVAAQEHDKYYANQRVLHWVDEIAHFTVLLKGKEYVFDGVCDMGLRTRLQNAVNSIEAQPQSVYLADL